MSYTIIIRKIECNKFRRIRMSDKKYEIQDKLKAAYALNMCTVSVSQIIDYNDEYILEQ